MFLLKKRRKISAACMPDHLSREILLRLPVKSLLRFRTGCKGWCHLISTTTFITNHLAISKRRSDLCLLGRTAKKEYFLCQDDGNRFVANSETKIVLPFTPIDEQLYTEVVGFCNGLACVGISHKPYCTTTYDVVLWNPIVKKHLTIKTRSSRAHPMPSVFGFGFDSVTRVYKLVNFHTCQHKICVSECCLGDGEWRMCVARHHLQLRIHDERQCPIFVNGKFHILVRRGWNNGVVVSFDLQTREFSEIVLPNFVSLSHLTLQVFKDSISLCKIDYCLKVKKRNYFISLWVMKEHGEVSSWTKVFVSRRNLPDVDKILGLRARGEVVYCCRKTGQINSYDPITKSRYNLGARIPDFGTCYLDSFTESLVLLNDATS